MGESAVLFHSYSFAAPLSRHEDNTNHALSQSVSFGRFMTENLEWGKWSSFSHKKYVDEAEKYSQPGSVAQKKAFFDAHYKKIAEAKKAKQEQPASVAVLLNTLDTLTKDETKEEESGETESDPSSEEFVSIEKDEEVEEPERNCVVVVLEQEDVVVENSLAEVGLQAVVEVIDGDVLEKSSCVEEKEEERKSVIKNSSVSSSETSDKAMELVVTRTISENSMKRNEKSVRPRFSFLKLLMGSTESQHQNSKRKTDKKPKKLFLCLCFNPEMVRETEGPPKTQRRNL